MHVEAVIGATRDKIWHALTNSRTLERWFCERADVSLDDGRYDFSGKYTPGDDVPHEIVKAVPGELLAYRWTLGDVDSTVTITLAESGGETIVSVDHEPDPAKPFCVKDFWNLALQHGLRGLTEFGIEGAGRFDFTCPTVHPERTEQSIEIDAPLEQVWGVLVADLENRWWVEDKSRVVIDAPHRASTPFMEWGSVVTWSLAASGGRTRVTLVHSGFEGQPDGPDIYHSMGWTDSLNWLRFLVEVGPSWMERHRRSMQLSNSRRAWFVVADA